MARKQSQTNSRVAGGATVSSRSQSPDLGQSVAPAAKPKIETLEGFEESVAAFLEDKHSNGPACSVAKMLEQVPDHIRPKVVAIIDSPDHHGARIVEFLGKWSDALGPIPTVHTILRHRKRGKANGCRCK